MKRSPSIYTDLADLDKSVLTCKAVHSHSWEDNPSYELTHPRVRPSFALLALRCTRCGRERFDFLNKNGSRNGQPYYRNPVNYPRTHRLTGQELMVELLSRSLLVHAIDRSRRNGK
jgi:hypothetical protein